MTIIYHCNGYVTHKKVSQEDFSRGHVNFQRDQKKFQCVIFRNWRSKTRANKERFFCCLSESLYQASIGVCDLPLFVLIDLIDFGVTDSSRNFHWKCWCVKVGSVKLANSCFRLDSIVVEFIGF